MNPAYLTPKTITFNAAKHDPSLAILWITSASTDVLPEMVSPIYALTRADLTRLIEGAERWLREMPRAPSPSAAVAKARQSDLVARAQAEHQARAPKPMRKASPPPPPVTPRHADGRLKAKPKAPFVRRPMSPLPRKRR